MGFRLWHNKWFMPNGEPLAPINNQLNGVGSGS